MKYSIYLENKSQDLIQKEIRSWGPIQLNLMDGNCMISEVIDFLKNKFDSSKYYRIIYHLGGNKRIVIGKLTSLDINDNFVNLWFSKKYNIDFSATSITMDEDYIGPKIAIDLDHMNFVSLPIFEFYERPFQIVEGGLLTIEEISDELGEEIVDINKRLEYIYDRFKECY